MPEMLHVRFGRLAIWTILLLSVLASTAVDAAPAGVIIDSVAGEVSVQSAGKNTWVPVRMYLVDASTHTIIMSSDFSAESTGPNTPQNAPAGVEKLPFDLANKAFAGTDLGKALRSVSDQVATEITRYIAVAK
jgi:hypothetical protein